MTSIDGNEAGTGQSDAASAANDEVRVARERVRRLERLTRERATLDTQIEQVRSLLTELEAELAKEEKDVSRLEHRFGAFLASLTGTKEEKLARERAEAEAVRLRLDGQRTRLEWLLSDLRTVIEGLSELDGAQREFDEALARRERALLDSADPRARELAEIARALADADANLREHEEAHSAGVAAAGAVAQVLRSLGGARSASTWDLLGGGGFADMVEHGHLREADQAAWHAQRALDAFSRELVDIGIQADPRLPQVDTRWFADAFFDNIIVDAVRHQKINRTAEAVSEVARWTDATLHHIAARRDDLARRRSTLLARREELLSS
ncbi:hypothetical protein AB0K60_05395 [Thermopolyspora sp. NPDC052614]|uniref:hypothetical protein n=1 Tax=Thermopolyspora sp. NPDC052614 TaxID=3155682 RepID=UPI0034134F71